MKPQLPKILLSLAAIFLAGAAAAGTYTVLSEKAMARQADAIVVGKVLDTRSQWVGRTLVTVADVQVSETLKGPGKAVVEVVTPGGIDASRRVPVAMTWPGAPRLVPQEQVLLFLNRTEAKPGALRVTGYSQGKYSIVRDGSGQTVVTRNASVAGELGAGGLSEGGTERRTLEEFRRQIRGYLNPTR